jgi:glycosyltransferase involved in cell wall biosynthesis
LKAECMTLVEELGLSDRVHFAGQVSNLHRLLPVLSLFVLSSRTEGLPNVLIEAQAAGVPCVCYDVGGISEAVDPEKTGLLVKEHTAAALAEAVLFALNNTTWRQTAVAGSPSYVRNKFSLDRMVDHLSDLILDPARGDNAGHAGRTN